MKTIKNLENRNILLSKVFQLKFYNNLVSIIMEPSNKYFTHPNFYDTSPPPTQTTKAPRQMETNKTRTDDATSAYMSLFKYTTTLNQSAYIRNALSVSMLHSLCQPLCIPRFSKHTHNMHEN